MNKHMNKSLLIHVYTMRMLHNFTIKIPWFSREQTATTIDDTCNCWERWAHPTWSWQTQESTRPCCRISASPASPAHELLIPPSPPASASPASPPSPSRWWGSSRFHTSESCLRPPPPSRSPLASSFCRILEAARISLVIYDIGEILVIEGDGWLHHRSRCWAVNKRGKQGWMRHEHQRMWLCFCIWTSMWSWGRSCRLQLHYCRTRLGL